ncbi:3-deoxy-manno-octulosonate cytidylyltransferase (CMP-KDO synthetase) [Anseongella ginsenosidimutans]|uniref:3-deoxy-manno-octulosonate cytidylyltransferase n=1 Tax=Anseongella ginsenosidimutans TaxID=496056 RepID=A0A4R3KN18_9SPHI|nr:3-deoxy-manno-octulosonate cytidylyltransferase [Anseongella ginsenosidimutans]QEC52750.1 3-deoxy-manno-octulosonate cytidylyltransferase [Anseongella ginsenosidimutans]TCS85507.1 3-deoxy-manno-octulosonate cytidylyltransferase (CMP-KDO synthetase) [Anseongella ginsenosidimutans]
MQKIIGIIPARFASVRFPGKPLADIGGKPMIRRVYEQVCKSSAVSEVVVATDDERILRAVTGFGGKAMLTSSGHQSGTDRCAEVAGMFPGYDIVINIQGDEPFIDPAQIDELCSCFQTGEKENGSGVELASLYKKITSPEELKNPNLPKIVMNGKKEAIYFSRFPVPYLRGVPAEKWLEHRDYYKHIGIYGYRRDILLEITKLPPSPLELSESLEQLRWLENGYTIRLAETRAATHAIDTPEDLQRVLKEFGGELN